MIKIICVGKLKENYLQKACNDYIARIQKYHKLEVIEILFQDNLEKERTAILKKIEEKDVVFLLEVSGKQMASEEFSKVIFKNFISNANITFIIGGSNGVHPDVVKRSTQQISFSKMTFPHQMFRLILLEQIYRAFKIEKNESYHK